MAIMAPGKYPQWYSNGTRRHLQEQRRLIIITGQRGSASRSHLALFQLMSRSAAGITLGLQTFNEAISLSNDARASFI